MQSDNKKSKITLVLYLLILCKFLYDLFIFIGFEDSTLQRFIEKTIVTILLFLIVLLKNK
jgi:hypothetical protein